MSGLRLLAIAANPALRRAVFGGDDDLDEGGLRAALALCGLVGGRADVWWSAPSQAALQTARAVGNDEPVVEKALADPDYGSWTGLGLNEVAAAVPEALHSWLTDPRAAPHGGEPLAAVRERAGAWLDSQVGQHAVAVAHPIVVRAALTHALGLPDDSMWCLEVAPLSLTRLCHHAGRWHVAFPSVTPVPEPGS